ncbi:hypothetical protein K438DRAFT_1851583 [Mycena galopus ATCC 62051]|nr:hypothetical protein K438DRAFT_1851583 [Mycena galopus ATCC 62051]
MLTPYFCRFSLSSYLFFSFVCSTNPLCSSYISPDFLSLPPMVQCPRSANPDEQHPTVLPFDSQPFTSFVILHLRQRRFSYI